MTSTVDVISARRHTMNVELWVELLVVIVRILAAGMAA